MKKKKNIPSAPEIELSVLGAIILENESFDKIIELLNPQSFYIDCHQFIYSTMLKMYNVRFTYR